MHYYEVSPVGIVRINSDRFTYASAEPLKIGSIVSIEVGKTSRAGVVTAEVKRPSFATKKVSSLIEPAPLPLPLLGLAEWLSEYYATHLGTVWQTILPRGVQKTRRSRQDPEQKSSSRTSTVEKLTPHQQTAVKKINQQADGTILLHGVTGSGKTQVYIEATKAAIKRGESVIVLTPEIGLTSQLVDDFANFFDSITLTHSQQTEAERHLAWQKALNSNQPMVVIGPRSALFMPLRKIGLIIIDEAHEPSYKQESAPRYHALRAASVLAKKHQARLVLGSATPAVADYYTAEQTKNSVVKMPTTAQAAVKPTITVVDMTKRQLFTQHRFFSDQLLDEINTTIKSGHQVLLFHNRRGSANITLCESCGWQAGCPTCFVPLTLHGDQFELRCHICGFSSRVPTSCPTCNSVNIIHKGIGTKLIESELRRLLPGVSIARFDGDTSKAGALHSRYEELYQGKISIIIGTQVVAKGLDLPKLGLVGIIQADAGLSLPDFGSSERTFQLLTQALGRVGRDARASKAIVQSYQPEHPIITHGLSQDYTSYYQHVLKERQRAGFPPFNFLLKLTCVYKTEAAAVRNARQLAEQMRVQLPSNVHILGPTPAFYERQSGSFRWQIVLKSKQRQELVDAMKLVPSTHWQPELDPVSLL